MNEKIVIALILFISCGIFGAAWYSNQRSVPSSATSNTEIMDTSKLTIVDSVVGTGAEAVNGKTVSVHYTGKLQNGTIFDSSVNRGTPFEFPLGAGMVIEGWELGIAGMKVGGKRTLTIPPELGYGSRDMGTIPPNSTLTFDVELLGVK